MSLRRVRARLSMSGTAEDTRGLYGGRGSRGGIAVRGGLEVVLLVKGKGGTICASVPTRPVRRHSTLALPHEQ